MLIILLLLSLFYGYSHISKKWTQFVCCVANFYCVTCHDLKPLRMDDVDFFKINLK
jgi:hypothetical protein